MKRVAAASSLCSHETVLGKKESVRARVETLVSPWPIRHGGLVESPPRTYQSSRLVSAGPARASCRPAQPEPRVGRATF